MRPPALPPSLPRSAKARRALVRLIDRLDRQRCCGRGCEWTEPHGASEGGGHSCGGETILEVALRVGCLLSCCPTIADRQERESRRRDSTAVYWVPQPCDDSTRPRLQTPTRTRAGRGVHLLRSHDRFRPHTASSRLPLAQQIPDLSNSEAKQPGVHSRGLRRVDRAPSRRQGRRAAGKFKRSWTCTVPTSPGPAGFVTRADCKRPAWGLELACW